MDILDGTGFWVTGDAAVVPPVPPAPIVGGDAAALIGFGHVLPGGAARRFYWRDKADPWEQIRAWLRRLVRQETPEWHVNPELLRAKQEREVHVVTRISRMMRRKR